MDRWQKLEGSSFAVSLEGGGGRNLLQLPALCAMSPDMKALLTP